MPLPGIQRYKCKVPFCPSVYYSQITDKKYSNKHFFSIPTDEHRRKLWQDAIGKAFNLTFTCSTKRAYICEDHFSPSCYNGGIRKNLLISAVPSVFTNTSSNNVVFNKSLSDEIDNEYESTETSDSATINEHQFVTPSINPDILDKICSIIGIYINDSGITWIKIATQNSEIQDWSFLDLRLLLKEMNPNEIYDVSYQIMQQLPEADIYVMHTIAVINSDLVQTTTYCQLLQLSSMLLALINSSFKHVINGNKRQELQNKVYFLQEELSFLIIEHLTNNRKESLEDVIYELLYGQIDNISLIPVTANSDIKSQFMKQSNIHKELLSQSLILAFTFINVCIYKNPCTLEIVKNKYC